jgi:sugar lactone lactonase YvrE
MGVFTIRRTLAAALAALAAVGAAVATGPAAQAGHAEYRFPLPGATSTEGIASGAGTTFYASDLFAGDIFRGDIRTRRAEKFIDNPPGRYALGLRVDLAHRLLFAAGGFDGRGYVYDLDSGATIATYQFSTATSVINDVAVTPKGAWFTNSSQAELYFVPVVGGRPGAFRTLHLSGPAADTSGGFNNNGIQATRDGATLIVAHTAQAALNTVDPVTGVSRTIRGVSVPDVDGILLEGRSLYAVENFSNQIVEVQLSGDLTSGSVRKVVTSSLFQTPTTVARFGDRLAAVNAKFDTGFPPTATSYEVVVVDR